MNYFITGIGTNVGKTIVSAILTEALLADYWKPIQSGELEGIDSQTIRSLLSNTKTVIHPETYLLKKPLSPHFAAKIDGITINLNTLNIPRTNNHLIIEGAGGILVPLNNSNYVIDITKNINCEIILVISNYLGCINHSLLSIDYLIKNKYRLKAIVFNGFFEDEIKQPIIDSISNTTIINIPTLNTLSKKTILEIATSIKNQDVI